jgi:hypothetical protein
MTVLAMPDPTEVAAAARASAPTVRPAESGVGGEVMVIRTLRAQAGSVAEYGGVVDPVRVGRGGEDQPDDVRTADGGHALHRQVLTDRTCWLRGRW